MKQLRPEQVARQIPVKVRGVIIGVLPLGLRLQDSTGGISVHFISLDWTHQPIVGDFVEAEGVTSPGLFAPVIFASKVRCLGHSPMPEPIVPRWDQLMNGSLDCEYVEIHGILTAASKGELTLLTADGIITVEVEGVGMENLLTRPPFSGSNGSPLVGSLVRLRGCCTPVADWQQRYLIHGRVHLLSPSIAVEELAPSNPFSLPTKTISELLWFDARASALQRVKLKGQVFTRNPANIWCLKGNADFEF